MRGSVGSELLNTINCSIKSQSQSPVKIDSNEKKALGNVEKCLQAGESILLTKKLVKINRWETKQYRTTIITNLHLFTFRDQHARRKVSLQNIEAISFSLTSNEFVLHIPKEYDLRFVSDNRVFIIHLIIKTRASSYMYAAQLLIYPHRNPTLENVTVTQDIVRAQTYRRLYLYESTPINCKLDDLSLEINRRVNVHRQKDGDILFMDNNFADQFFNSDLQPIMSLYDAACYTCTLVRCIKSRRLFTSKLFHKNRLRVSVDFFRNCLVNHQNNRFKQHLYCATQHQNSFVLVFKFYSCGDLYGQRNFIQMEYTEDVLRHIMIRSIFGINRLEQQDYKPLILENVLVAKNGNTFISDYIHYTQQEGSKEYLSPQQVIQSKNKSGNYDPKMCNLWRLGILIYEFAFGVTPFSLCKLLWSIQKNQTLKINFPKLSALYSTAFQQMITKLLSKDPKQRPGYNGMSDYVKMAFFKDVDWEMYSSSQVLPPANYHHTDIEYQAYEFGGAKILFE